VNEEEEGSLRFEGVTLLADWVLTGESRPYDVKRAVFGRVEPAEPYKPFRGQWGAFELAGRVSWLDLSDGDVSGGRMLTTSVGPVWTWNRWVRLLASYVYARVSDSPQGSDAHVFQARLELRI
jgi:phosphate-selective porin OprO/OprP